MWSTLQKENEEQSQNSTAYELKYSYIVFWLTMYGLRVVGSAVYNVAQGAFMKQNYESFVLLHPTFNNNNDNDDGTVRDPMLQQMTAVAQQQRRSSSLWLRSLTNRQRHILLSLICLLVDFLVNFILLMAVGPLLATLSFAGWGDSDSGRLVGQSAWWDAVRSTEEAAPATLQCHQVRIQMCCQALLELYLVPLITNLRGPLCTWQTLFSTK